MPVPSDDRLDAWILARLELIGVDISVLPDAATPDAPVSRPALMASLRSFLGGTVPEGGGARSGGTVQTVSDWSPPPADDLRLGQQSAPPALYPSIVTAWTQS